MMNKIECQAKRRRLCKELEAATIKLMQERSADCNRDLTATELDVCRILGELERAK